MLDLFDRLKTALADRYAIEREIGAGGMATVYLAEDLKHHRKVAVKVLRTELAVTLGAERFLREIAIAARLAMCGHAPFNGAVFAMVEVHVAVPRSWSKKKQAAALAGNLRPTSRPDLDNVVKVGLDACTGVVFLDDAQVVECASLKSYSLTPKLVITVTLWLGAPAMGEVAE